MRRLLVFTCCCALTFSVVLAPASAFAYGTLRLEQAAQAFWGDELADACPEGIVIDRELPSADPNLELLTAAGWAYEPFNGVHFCEVHLSTVTENAFEWMGECPTALHETGHVIGHQHGWPGRGNIMDAYALLVRSDGFIWRHGRKVHVVQWSGPGARWCRRYAERHYPRSFARERDGPRPVTV